MFLRQLSIFFILCLMSLRAGAQVDFAKKEILSFESSCEKAEAKGGKIKISSKHNKLGNNSLEWSWKKADASLTFKTEVPYLSKNPNPKETSVSTFVFWVYSPEKLEGELLFEFLKDGKVCSSFPYRLGFAGWRGAWVAFDRDMDGKPEEGMNSIRISVKGAVKGRLYFDGLIPSAFEDVRHHTADFQAPFINKNTDSHWLLLLKHWNKSLDIPLPKTISDDDRLAMQNILERFVQITERDKKPISLKKAREIFGQYDIRYNNDGTITGKPIFFTRYGETFINLDVKDASARFKKEGQLLRDYNDNLLKIALTWKNSASSKEKEELARMYVLMTRHLLDQGFAAGSAQGTLHHLGYSMRNFYTAPVIMKDELRKAGIMDEVQRAMEWFSGVGEVKIKPEAPGMDIDAFNTYLLGRTASLLMLEDTPYKFAYLKALSRWIDNGFNYAGGLKACFKPDGMVFHHRRAYPAYAIGGFDGAVNSVWMLRGTPFAISGNAHEILKNALLEMRVYCNLRTFPLAMSGRHPDGKGELIPEQYAILADAGSPDGKELIDKELASAYLRLSKTETEWSKKFRKDGIEAEKSPQGVKAYGYNCSVSARYEDRLVTIAGHSRYLWSAEIYQGANHYGRYLTHGSMEIKNEGNSGYQVDGYDWCHIPGTTAGIVPLEKMKANILNVDEFSGYEEMLLSDEWFAGGVSYKDKGVFAMKLHEHDKYNGSLRVQKSFFIFGNRVVCLGSNITSDIPVHTTLFQNCLTEKADNDTVRNVNILKDRFGNIWQVSEGKTVFTRGLQHSYHEETDAPTSGFFEKAWIENETGGYEYITWIHPDDFTEDKTYSVLAKNEKLHCVKDLESGMTGAAVFDTTAVDEHILLSSPCTLIYGFEDSLMSINVSHPDLALYDGASDEVFDEKGKRVERSIYGRKWVDNDCGERMVRLVISGEKKAVEVPQTCKISYNNGNTILEFYTSEAKTERLILK